MNETKPTQSCVEHPKIEVDADGGLLPPKGSKWLACTCGGQHFGIILQAPERSGTKAMIFDGLTCLTCLNTLTLTDDPTKASAPSRIDGVPVQ